MAIADSDAVSSGDDDALGNPVGVPPADSVDVSHGEYDLHGEASYLPGGKALFGPNPAQRGRLPLFRPKRTVFCQIRHAPGFNSFRDRMRHPFRLPRPFLPNACRTEGSPSPFHGNWLSPSRTISQRIAGDKGLIVCTREQPATSLSPAAFNHR